MTGEFGYAGEILRVDLSSASMTTVPTANYADRFLGGRGIAAKIYWDEVSPHVNALDAENRLIFITGPLTGLSRMGDNRWLICGKSPAVEPEHFSYANLGGRWGIQLKSTGYDGIVIQGKSERPVYLFIQDGIAELRDAATLWGRNSVEVRTLLKSELGNSVGVVAIGPAGESLVSMATVLAEGDASGSSFGAVMGSKKLKAIAVKGKGRPKVANAEKLRELTQYIRELRPEVNVGFTRWQQLVPSGAKIMKQERCPGCISGCSRASYEAANGDKGKFYCQSSAFYNLFARSYYGRQTEVPFKATKLCDKYGLDTNFMVPMIQWLSKCYEAGILTDQNTGLPLSKLGSLEFIETLVQKISFREGFGDVLAQGIYRAADSVGSKAKEMITDYVYKGRIINYSPRLYITTGLLYAMEPRRPIAQLHAVSSFVGRWRNWLGGLKGAGMSSEVIRAIAQKFWGSELAADFSTYEGKALAAKMIQDREYVKECLILCDSLWPLLYVERSENHLGDSALESRLYSAVTGNEVDEAELYRIGERVCNLQRAILVREGHRGRENDRLPEFDYTVPLTGMYTGLNVDNEFVVPGKDGEPISRKDTVVDREKYERVLDEYYQLRGWDARTGLQTRANLADLQLEDVARDLEPRGLIR